MNMPAPARAIVGALLLLAAAAAPARAQSLTLLIWEAYVSPHLIQLWKQRTHTDINQIYFDSGDERDSMLSNLNSTVDLTIIDGARIGMLGKRGLLAELRQDTVANLALIAPRWRDACGPYGAAYFWGTDGILYRSDKLPLPPRSWQDLLHPAAAMDRHVTMLKDDDDILAAPLSFLGKPSNTDNVDDLRQAFALLKAQGPAVLTYDYIVTAQQEPAFRGRIYMGMGFTGDRSLLNREPGAMDAWHFATPREGSVIWTDCLAVLAKSPHRALALQFIDFLNEPANAAENSVYLQMPTPNTAALKLVPEAIRNDPEIYPSAEVIARSQLKGVLPAATLQLRRRIVSALVNADDAQ